MERPHLRQFGELRQEDFEKHPVWVACHGLDEDEPWYEETDEETFRPWTGPLPVNPSDGMFLVRATARIKDGSQMPGFATPALAPDDLGTMQPQVFVKGHRFGFWGGMFGVPHEQREVFYSSLGKTAGEVFPLDFAADSKLTSGICTGRVLGFYRSAKGSHNLIEQ